MKNRLKMAKVLGLAVVLFQWEISAQAVKIPIVLQFGGEKVSKVSEFPCTKEFETRKGEHIDPGCIYRQFSFFGIPLWNYEKKWCGYIGDSEHYLALTKVQLDRAAQLADITLPSEPPLPPWDAYGGKLSLVALIFGYRVVTVLSRRHSKTT
jgi:hypothetical protein